MLTRILLAITVLLILASLTASVLLWQTDHDYALGFVPTFRVDLERSIPACFSAGLLAVCSGLLAVIATARRRLPEAHGWHWVVLAGGFGLMSVDEIVGFHERLIAPISALLDVQGPSVLYFAWVVPGLILAAVLGLYFLPFLRRLPPATAGRFVLAGAIYLGGALGVEMIGGYYASSFPDYQTYGTDIFFGYELIVTVEEAMEMLGLIVFLRALLLYCAHHMGEIRFAFDDGRATPHNRPEAS